MNKEKFADILNNHEVIEKDDLEKIAELEKNFPYSQVLHALSALANYKYQTINAKQKLNKAAVYATDRSVLKEIMLAVDAYGKQKPPVETSPTQREDKAATLVSPEEPPQAKKQTTKQKPTLQKETVIVESTDRPGYLTTQEAEELRQDVMKNLEELMLVKSNFMKRTETGIKPDPKAKKKRKTGSIKKVKKKTDNPGGSIAETSLSPKKATSKKVSHQKVTSTKATLKKAAPKKKKVVIQKTGKKEQRKIIERFIKEEPSLKKSDSRKDNADQSDLSVHSVEFGEDLVSENLARIMIKQGKKSKAMDIYKKLIWKYPQKKAYFASQIESLKEK